MWALSHQPEPPTCVCPNPDTVAMISQQSALSRTRQFQIRKPSGNHFDWISSSLAISLSRTKVSLIYLVNHMILLFHLSVRGDGFADHWIPPHWRQQIKLRPTFFRRLHSRNVSFFPPLGLSPLINYLATHIALEAWIPQNPHISAPGSSVCSVSHGHSSLNPIILCKGFRSTVHCTNFLFRKISAEDQIWSYSTTPFLQIVFLEQRKIKLLSLASGQVY